MILPWNELGSFSGAFLIFTVEFFVKSMFCILLMLAIEHLIWRKRPLLADICWRGMLLFMIMLPAVILLLPEMRLLPDPGFSESFRKTAFLQERQLTPRFSESGLPTETVLREMSVQISPLMSTERQSVPERKSIRSNTLSMGTLLSITSLVAFCLGGFFFLVRLLLSWRALKNIHTKAKVDLSEIYDLMNSLKTEMGIRQEIRLLYSSEISVPMTYGFWNPCILIPTSLKDTDDQKTITAVLIHELVHIARADFKYQLMIKLIRCCYWWHPGFWWMQRRIETLAELICDGYTAGQMQSRQEYVDVLLNQAGRLVHGTPPSCTLAMASFRLKQRLQALALIKVNQFTETPVRYGVGLLFFFVIALICGTLGWTSSNISQSYAESTLIDGNQRTIKRFRELEYNSLGNKLQKSVILPQGTLSGRVVNAEGRPLSGVLVDACTWCKGTETYTDESGGFLLTGFEVGSKVQVQFSHTKYASHLVESQPVDRQNWEVALNTDSSLSGKVLSPDGKPVPGAKVNVVRVSFSPMFNENVEVVETVETDETGSYKLLLEPARYELRVRVPEVGGYRLQGLIIREQENRTFDIKLAKQARFQARLIDVITEKPVPGVRLESQQLKGVKAVSNAEGVIDLSDIPVGKYRCWLRGTDESRAESGTAEGYGRWWSDEATDPYQQYRVDPGQFQRNFDYLDFEITENSQPITIMMEPAVTLKGRLLDPNGKPVSQGTVTAALTGTGNSLTGDGRYSFRTDASGQFVMYLPAAQDIPYNLVGHDGKYNKWRNWANGVGVPFKTKPGEVIENLEIKLTQPGTVRGMVVDEAGVPQPGVHVMATPKDLLQNRYYLPYLKSDENGEFELRFLRPGKHWLQANSNFMNGNDAPPGLLKEIEIKENQKIENIQLIKAP